jgi:hypothetical protein
VDEKIPAKKGMCPNIFLKYFFIKKISGQMISGRMTIRKTPVKKMCVTGDEACNTTPENFLPKKIFGLKKKLKNQGYIQNQTKKRCWDQ